ncbi:HD domain-containing protein [Apilactobacillus micheneri]|uniref:Hydrolase n=1 Tax=Apilactobacillus micheneri TaxID=1899430 RepID=A0A9Q8INP3_9LACO|nr:HD domain-containing protein [Apilactobacillus micheneri]TPR40541.1 hydrolase [Apilactobacillus micheneri]TPR42008.1 hydrolase [Apilactobacillus micheneri]TPR44663.1 hydrolase [Apilactobacillus micheneri]TPR44962.1 hydrolase [Apilactobacillus micheneri]TPR46304.1 hydrolase [Apilactobacillus micheneri]
MNTKAWKNDKVYMSYVSDLLNSSMVKELSNYTQHHSSTRLKHCIDVSYESYQIAKNFNLDAKSTARAGLLHDLFYYDWRTDKFHLGSHAYMHPRIALRNAEKITNLNDKEKDIIIKHMWGLTLSKPKYAESVIVSLVDDYDAVREYFAPKYRNIKQIFSTKSL